MLKNIYSRAFVVTSKGSIKKVLIYFILIVSVVLGINTILAAPQTFAQEGNYWNDYEYVEKRGFIPPPISAREQVFLIISLFIKFLGFLIISMITCTALLYVTAEVNQKKNIISVLKRSIRRWETKFIFILLCTTSITYILAIKQRRPHVEYGYVMNYLMSPSWLLIALSLSFLLILGLIILIPIQLIRYKYYKILLLHISILLFFILLFFVAPLKLTSYEPTGAWCTLRGGEYYNYTCNQYKMPALRNRCPTCD